MKVFATVEARMGSTRLPGKVLLPLAGKESLWHIVSRLRACDSIDETIVATTTAPQDRAIIDFCEREQIRYVAGSEDNIVDRLLQATAADNPDVIVQATGDNPFIEPRLVDEVVHALLSGDFDYAGNHFSDMPMGMEVRAFTRQALLRVAALTNDPIDLIHGSYFIYRRPDLFAINQVKPSLPDGWMPVRLTVDEPADYKLAYQLYQALYGSDMTCETLFAYLKQHPDLLATNQSVKQKRPEHA